MPSDCWSDKGLPTKFHHSIEEVIMFVGAYK